MLRPWSFFALLSLTATLTASLTAGTLVGGCAPIRYIPGTRVPDSKVNRDVLQVCEKYRQALEDRDGDTLLTLASKNYFEDSGTPKGEDDYGYDGLRQVINTRLGQLKSIRYNIDYRGMTVQNNHASVDIRYDTSYQIATELGDRWDRKQNEKRLELEFDGKKWLFVGGM
jgi:hypothetical protein